MIKIEFYTDLMKWQTRGNYKYKFILRNKFLPRMKEMADLLAEEFAKNAPEGATGDLKDSFRTDFIQNDENSGLFTWAVSTNIPYAHYVDKGRGPNRSGTKIPYSRIQAWANKKIPGASKSFIYMIWKRIMREGFIGNYAPYNFMQKSLDELNRGRFQEILNQAGLDWSRFWSE